MGDFAIGVKIAGRQYKMTINPDSEDNVNKAAQLINDRINQFTANYAFNDKQDLLAMVALQFTTELVQQKSNKEVSPESNPMLLEKLKEIESLLKEE